MIDARHPIGIVLQLFQHRSRDPDLGGDLELDGLVWGWKCVRPERGKNYVLLLWQCTNPGSKLCHSAMSIRDEWTAIYDEDGRSIQRNPRYLYPEEKKKLQNLGLWQDFL